MLYVIFNNITGYNYIFNNNWTTNDVLEVNAITYERIVRLGK